MLQHSHWLALGSSLPVVTSLLIAPASLPYLATTGLVGIAWFLTLVIAWRLRSQWLHLMGSFFVFLVGMSRVGRFFQSEPQLVRFLAIGVPFFVAFLLLALLRHPVRRFSRIPDKQIPASYD